VSAKGDPHLTNIHGQRFDVLQPGVHVLLHIPMFATKETTKLKIEALAARFGADCSEMYFTEVNVTGGWMPRQARRQGHPGIMRFAAGGPTDRRWMQYGKLMLKVVSGQTRDGKEYLNVWVKNLRAIAGSIGGLLGDGDHSFAASPPNDCKKRVTTL